MSTIPGKFDIRLNQLLMYVSQEEIFQLIFKIYPEEGEQYCSPFRVDSSPGCYFRYNDEGKLKFIDWADMDNSSLDCFEAIKKYYNFSSYTEVIHLIYEVFIEGKDPALRPENVNRVVPTANKTRTQIGVHKQDYTPADMKYWNQYGITEENLKEDKILSINKTYIKSRKGEFIINSGTELSFADISFPSGNRKVYFPENDKNHKRRFITNCTQNDVGNMQNIDYTCNYIIITKSHKDFRVLKNSGYKNTVYFSNEGQYPSKEILSDLTKFFNLVYIFFDNDSAGIKASLNLKNKISDVSTAKVVLVYIKNIFKVKDIADMYKFHGEEVCNEFLKDTLNVPST